MGIQLLWTGLTLIMAKSILPLPALEIVGAVIMILGCILMWIGR